MLGLQKHEIIQLFDTNGIDRNQYVLYDFYDKKYKHISRNLEMVTTYYTPSTYHMFEEYKMKFALEYMVYFISNPTTVIYFALNDDFLLFIGYHRYVEKSIKLERLLKLKILLNEDNT